MQWTNSIPLVSIFLPILTGLLALPCKSGRIPRRLSIAGAALVAILSLLLLAELYPEGQIFRFSMGHFPAPWGNELRAGPVEALFSLVYSVIFFLCCQDKPSAREIRESKRAYYFACMNLLLGSMLALIYTNDLFTAYVFLELSTIAACAIIMVKDSGESLVETLRYLIMYVIGSTFFLLGIVLLYSITGHLLMEPLAAAVAGLAASGNYPLTLSLAAGLLLLGLAVKSAIFPFHSILPGAHGSAVSAASAILSGLLLEVYVLLLMKLLCRVFTLEIALALHLPDGLLLIGLAAMVLGSLAAMGERNIKRMLAYSSAAQIGYLYVGLGLGSVGGLVAAGFHIIAHAATKAMLFLCAGSFSRVSGHSLRFDQLRGAAWRQPLAGIGFTLGGISLIGVPLLACFVSKLYLAQSALDGSWRALLVLISLGLSMLLNALYFTPAAIAIWSKKSARGETTSFSATQLRASMLDAGVPVLVLLAANIALGIAFGPVLACLQKGFALF